MDKYENLGTVGEGSYGVVIKCKDKTNGNLVAIKKFLESENDRAVKKIAFREIKILKALRHENLVNLIEVFRRNRRIYLVFEYIDQNLLEEIEKSKNGLGEDRTREVMYQVVRGIDFMHSNNIIHRDIKPENILINTSGLIKLCDFGFARQLAQPSEVYTDYVATRWYRSPELLVGDPKYGKPVDIWSIGVLAYEVLTSRPLFPGESDLDQLFLIMNSIGDITESMKQCFQKNQFYMNSKLPKIKNFSPLQNKLKKYSANMVKFIMDSLIIDPHKRYTSAELLLHNLFLENNWVDEFVIKIKKLVAQHESSFNSNRSITVQSVLGKGDTDSIKTIVLDNKPKESISEKGSISLNITQKPSQPNVQQSNQPKLSLTNTTTTTTNNNFFNQQNDESKATSQTNDKKSVTTSNQKFIKNLLIKPNFLISNANGKENNITNNTNGDYYTASFTSTVVNNSIKKFAKKTNPNVTSTKDNVVVEIKNSKILPKIENQQPVQSESPRLEIQTSKIPATTITTNNQTTNSTSQHANFTSMSFNLYKQQQNQFTTNNTNTTNLTSFSNLSMRKSPNNEIQLTNSSLGILNDMTSLKRSNSNNTIIMNQTNTNSSQSKTNNYFIDENFKLNKKPANLTSSTSDMSGNNANNANGKTSLSRQDTQINKNQNVRLPQMKSHGD